MEKFITYVAQIIALIVIFGVGLILTGLLMLGIQSVFSLLI